jgi:hypothetical protein
MARTMPPDADKRRQTWTPERRARHSAVMKACWAKKKALGSSHRAVKDTPKAITPDDSGPYSVGFIGRLLAWVGFSR